MYKQCSVQLTIVDKENGFQNFVLIQKLSFLLIIKSSVFYSEAINRSMYSKCIIDVPQDLQQM